MFCYFKCWNDGLIVGREFVKMMDQHFGIIKDDRQVAYGVLIIISDKVLVEVG